MLDAPLAGWLGPFLNDLFSRTARVEPRVRVAGLRLAWGGVRALQGTEPLRTCIGFGRRIVDGVLFPAAGMGNARSDANLAVLKRLNALGVKIPCPQRVLRTLPAAEAAPGAISCAMPVASPVASPVTSAGCVWLAHWPDASAGRGDADPLTPSPV